MIGSPLANPISIVARPRSRHQLGHLELGYWAAWILPVLLLGLVQASLALREPIFSPIDELEHTDYVRLVAEEHRPPIYGQDQISPVLRAIYVHTYPSLEMSPALASAWEVRKYNYEALQFPAFYVLAAPVYALLDGPDPHAAIYAVRLVNVALSLVLLVQFMLLLRRRLALSPALSSLIALFLLIPPGIALRHSQVTNQVLTAVLVTLVIHVATETEPGGRRQMAWGGFFLGLATMSKLTGIGAAVALAPALLTKPFRSARLLAAAAGAALPIGIWLLWALPVYGSPIPLPRHRLALWTNYYFVPPPTLHGKLLLAHQFVRDFWFPYEWQPPGGTWKLFGELSLIAGSLILAAAVIVGVALVIRRGPDRQLSLVCLLSLAAVTTGYAVISIGRHWIGEADLREFYPFLGALALLCGMVATRVNHKLAVAGLSAMLGLWLLNDFALYIVGSCVRCAG